MVLGHEVRDRSVQLEEPAGQSPGSGFFIQLASVADSFPAWGSSPAVRDVELRKFFPTEPILLSAIYAITIRNAAFSWALEGPKRTVAAVQDIFNMADRGAGWLSFVNKIGIDLFTQDNGAFIEVIRRANSAESLVIGVNHLDAGRCARTGNSEFPVNYTDRKGVIHRLAYYQVISLAEFPTPIESMHGMQYCAVTRVLRAAQLMRDLSIFQREKIAGDNPSAIHLVGGGIKSSEISDAMQEHKDAQVQKGMIRYVLPLVMGSLDPTATISHEQIDLKSLPDGFNFDEAMRWYINQLALGFGADYQDFAPLPGRNLGSSTQSMILHEKSRGRGPALFMKLIEYALNWHGVIPKNVQFRYDEPDVQADTEQAELWKTRSETLSGLVEVDIIDTQAARQMMLDSGGLDPVTFDRLSEEGDVTPDVTVPDVEHPEGGKGTKQEVEGVSDFAEEQRVAMEEEYGDRLARALAESFEEAKKLIGAKGLRLLGTKQGPDDLLHDPDWWADFRLRMVTTTAEMARRTALGAAEFNATLGLAFDMDLVNQEVLAYTRVYTNQWWQKLEQVTRANLNEAIATWQESGLGTRGLPDLVDAIEPMFNRVRAERIATTEITRVFDEGNRLAHIAAGIEVEEWQTSKDALVCPICSPLDGERFPTDGGPRPVTGTHIGCRCARLPVASDGSAITKRP